VAERQVNVGTFRGVSPFEILQLRHKQLHFSPIIIYPALLNTSPVPATVLRFIVLSAVTTRTSIFIACANIL
jgi:hypothetical protein